MTTRHSAILVTLTRDVREDDLEPLLTALSCFELVAAAEPVEGDVTTRIVESGRVRLEVAGELRQMAEKILDGSP